MKVILNMWKISVCNSMTMQMQRKRLENDLLINIKFIDSASVFKLGDESQLSGIIDHCDKITIKQMNACIYNCTLHYFAYLND